MPEIPKEAYPYFEKKIYFPMLMKILERDIEVINRQSFKLPRPYLTKIDKALNLIRQDLKQADIYLMRHNMRLAIGRADSNQVTEYTFIHYGYEERHKYTSEQLKRRTEELMVSYLSKV